MVNIDYPYSHANPLTNTEAHCPSTSFLHAGIFFQFWEVGCLAFQIGKISVVNP